MTDAAAVRHENEQRFSQPLREIEILWLNGGLGCDGESVALTGATQPSVEDLVMGAIPGLPKVKLHNPFLAYENGEEFLDLFRRAAEGRLEPFILVVEGSIPDEGNKPEGYWASFGADAETGQPVTTCEWVDRLAPKAWAVVAVGTCAAYGGIHVMQGNVTGDTKVVQKGSADKIFINTAGIGIVESPVHISAARAAVGDKVILSGAVGDHGTTILIARGELELETDIESDTAPLNALVSEMLDEAARAGSLDGIHALRDPTRGGVATTLNEIALASEMCIEIREDLIPVREEVHGACEILGLDPLYVANEGKLIAVVSSDIADRVVARMKEHPYGRGACVIGEVKAEPQGIVAMRTGFGGTRIVDMLVGEQLPRIC